MAIRAELKAELKVIIEAQPERVSHEEQKAAASAATPVACRAACHGHGVAFGLGLASLALGLSEDAAARRLGTGAIAAWAVVRLLSAGRPILVRSAGGVARLVAWALLVAGASAACALAVVPYETARRWAATAGGASAPLPVPDRERTLTKRPTTNRL